MPYYYNVGQEIRERKKSNTRNFNVEVIINLNLSTIFVLNESNGNY